MLAALSVLRYNKNIPILEWEMSEWTSIPCVRKRKNRRCFSLAAANAKEQPEQKATGARE